jgi:hypothetical protein
MLIPVGATIIVSFFPEKINRNFLIITKPFDKPLQEQKLWRKIIAFFRKLLCNFQKPILQERKSAFL